MKTLVLVPLFVASLAPSFAFAATLKFEGKIVEAKRFSDRGGVSSLASLVGKPCSLRMESTTPRGDQGFRYKAFPKVQGKTYSFLSREVPPTRVLYVTDRNNGDLFAMKGDLVGTGSKHRHGGMIDLSQRIYIEVDGAGKKVVGWRYLDQWYGNSMICR